MNLDLLIKKALRLEFLNAAQALALYHQLPLGELVYTANELRKIHHPENKVTWIIDRNVNITNACISGCKFCNFYLPVSNKQVYITTLDEYASKIEEMKCKSCGGTLTAENIKLVNGAPMVTCPYCNSVYQLTEEPKW